MANKKIGAVMAVTLGVWVAALGSAAALTYELNRPLHLRNTPSIEAPSGNIGVSPAEAKPDMQTVLYLPPVTIVGRALHRAAAHVPKTSKPFPTSDARNGESSRWSRSLRVKETDAANP
jgi:hypothetical protein